MKLKSTVSAALLAGGMTLSGVATAADVVIGVPNWPSVAATANVLKVIIEDNLGLEVELQNGTNPIVFEAMDSGAMHAHPEVWMPNQQNLHDTFVKTKGTVAMNPNGVPAFQGMCVPKAFASDGDGRGEVWIGAPGWASTNVEKIRAKSYGYDQTFELTESDETLAYANLDNAIKAGKPWVGFCYTPHYVFVLHDMQILEEPAYDGSKWKVVQPTDDPAWLEVSTAPTAWDTAYLHLHYAKGIEKAQPEVAKLFNNMKLTTDQVSEMTYALVIDKKDPAAYAKEWVEKNEDAVLGWLTN
jgi:glycine betaine/proline transport system substrate-binding protein